MSRRELKSLVEDSNGFTQALGRTRGRTMATPNPSVTTPIGTNSRDVEALEAAKNEELLKLQLQELEGNAEISRMKLELEHLKSLDAQRQETQRVLEEQRQGFQTQILELKQEICAERESRLLDPRPHRAVEQRGAALRTAQSHWRHSLGRYARNWSQVKAVTGL